MKRILPVSIIIPIKEAQEDAINRLAQAVFDQTAWPAEIVLVNASSQDSRSFGDNFRHRFDDSVTIKTVFASNAYPGKARNLGVAKADQRLIAFLDLMTIPNSAWLEKYYERIVPGNCDGMIGSTKFIGGNFFSWILIDSLFGRGPVASLPGSLFTAEGFKKVGPMLDKIRAGEDNEWMQRAELIEVDFRRYPEDAACRYLGFQEITFQGFCRKWIRNYWTAANLPQYKLIAQFNLLMWFFLVVGFAVNWNAFFAGWDVSHQLYLPHISKITFATLFFGYFFYRAVYLPIRRGSKLRQILNYRIFLIFFIVATADVIKSGAFLLRSISPRL